MDTLRDRVIEALFSAVDDVNSELPAGRRLEKSERSALFGKTGTLSSLELVNLIVCAEQRIEDRFGVLLTLVDERAVSRRSSPFRTLGSLADYASALLEEGRDE